MAKPFHLQPLIDLAAERSQAALHKLGLLRNALQQSENKLQQLQGYLQEYRDRLQQHAESGFTVAQWMDYQAFIQKLELAIKVQEQEVERCRHAWNSGQIDWQICERELKAYQTLRQRHEETERKKDERQDQHLQDEFARNQHRRKSQDQE